MISFYDDPRAQLLLNHEPAIMVSAVGERIWCAGAGCLHTLFWETDEGVIAIDSLGTPGRARSLARTIGEVTQGKPISHVILSNDHLDRSGFVRILAPDAILVAHTLCSDVLRVRGFGPQGKPDSIIHGPGVELRLGGRSVRLLYAGPSSGSGNVAVLLPDAGLLFMAGTLLPNARYGMLPDYHLGHFTMTMAIIAGQPFRRFVPGRYKLMSPMEVEVALGFLHALELRCQLAFDEGVPEYNLPELGAYACNALREEFGGLEGFEQHVPLSAFRYAHHYLMGGWGLEDCFYASYPQVNYVNDTSHDRRLFTGDLRVKS